MEMRAIELNGEPFNTRGVGFILFFAAGFTSGYLHSTLRANKSMIDKIMMNTRIGQQ